MRELTFEETDEVSGAIDASLLAAGAAFVALGVGIAVTGGLAAVPISVLLGAATGGELLLAASALGLAGSGGYLIGSGICY